MMQDIIIPILSFLLSLVLVICFIAFGWYIVWTLFLKRFKFVRELLGMNEIDNKDKEKSRKMKSKIRRE